MIKLLFLSALFVALGLLAFIACKMNDTQLKRAGFFFALIFAVSFFIRIYFATQNLYFGYDMSCFEAWGELCRQRGFKNMYTGDFFLDYPPMYIYVLWLTAVVRCALGIAYESVAHAFLIKLCPVICDMLIGLVVYKLSAKKLGENFALSLSALWLLNPAMIYNSAVWGQVDSFYILFLLLSVYFAEEKNTVFASVCYGVALLTKPQTLLFGPVFLFYIINRRDIKQFFVAVATGLLTLWALALPFSQTISPMWLLGLYKNTMNGYRLFTFNGYNLYALLGLNQVSLSKYTSSGIINLLVIGAVMAVLTLANRRAERSGDYFDKALFLIATIFTFGTMMHERYILPAIAMALFAFIYTEKPKFYLSFLSFSAFSYLNIAHTMMVQIQNYEYSSAAVRAMGLFCLVSAVFVIWHYLENVGKVSLKLPQKSCGIGALVLVCGLLQFWNLGSFNAPTTFYQAENEGDWFVLQFEQPQQVEKIFTYLGMGDEGQGEGRPKIKCDFEILAPDDEGLWQDIADLNHSYVFTWKEKDVSLYTDRVMLRAKSRGAVLGEIVLLNENGDTIYGHIDGRTEGGRYPPENALDESHFVPKDFRDYYYSSYFDEVYFARTGYEILKGYSVYETTHPHIGKILISVGIALFGMSPFGWRFMGAVAGVLSVYCLYLLAKQLFKNERVALFGATVYALDFMRYTQTRIATVDSFLVLFIILMFLFMTGYENRTDKTDEFTSLFLSGIFMGCAVGTKWNGVYSATGLALYFFFVLYKKCKAKGTGWKSYFTKTVLSCVLCFVILPACIYFVSFYPAIKNSCSTPLKRFWDCQVSMLSYHKNLVAEHFFSSPWYSWLVVYKPIWYRVSRSGKMVSTISAMGNPVIWLLFPVAVSFSVCRFAKGGHSADFVSVAGYFASLLPWVLITRLTFIYHYYPCTIFGILAVTSLFASFTNNFEKSDRNKVAWCYLFTCLFAFVLFFAVISGFPATAEYVDSLEILPTWFFN